MFKSSYTGGGGFDNVALGRFEDGPPCPPTNASMCGNTGAWTEVRRGHPSLPGRGYNAHVDAGASYAAKD